MPSRALSGRDPQNGKNGFSKTKGFTVIELMIVVAVMAIVASLALPSYRTIIEKRQVTSGAEQVAAFLSSAQLEAVRRNENVAVSYVFSGPGDWCVGMTVGSDPCDCVYDPSVNAVDDGATTCKIEGVTRAFSPANLTHAEALEAIDGDDDLTFVIDPVRGLMVDPTDGASFQFLSQPENTYALNVQIGVTGVVRICSDTSRADTLVPGFKPCS
jgi:prepilin-type N-terminal cleavage/methylation domain-containing protein